MGAHRVQHLRHGAGNVKETYPTLHEGFNSNFVRRVEDSWRAAAFAQGLARKTQGREAFGVGWHEVEPRQRGKIEPGRRRAHALSPCQWMCDRNTHVGRAELCQYAAIAVADHAVDDR